MPARFTYERLNHNRKEIRYLQILSEPGVIIKCRLINATLQPGHICLSHRWTDKDGTREIYVNDKPFTVSTSLWHFLNVARHKYESGERFWIDAICIDQASLTEKNKQVPFMGEIYSQARLVVSWLGLCDPPSKMCLDAIQNRKLNLSTNHFNHAVSEIDEFWPRFWDHLVRFFQHDYWRRAWVVQEVLLAADGYLLMGDIELSWGSLMEYWDLVTRSDIAPQTHLKRLCDWKFGHEQGPRQAVKSGRLAPLRSLLTRYGEQSCNDFHDHVYSLLSLAVDRDRVTVDYRSERETLFFDTLWACGVEKCFCHATRLMNILRIREQVVPKGQKAFTTGSWKSLRLETDADQNPVVSFGINMEDTLPLGPDVYYTTHADEAQWLRNLPRGWKWQTGRNIRFLYTAVPADFLIRQAPDNYEWYCAAVRFHSGKVWTKHMETFPLQPDNRHISGITVHAHSNLRPCCLQLTRSALLKLLIFGEQHSVCHESSLGAYELADKNGMLTCGRPVQRYSHNVVRRASVPYRSESVSSTPRIISPPLVGSGWPAATQMRSHAAALRESLGQIQQQRSEAGHDKQGLMKVGGGLTERAVAARMGWGPRAIRAVDGQRGTSGGARVTI